MTTSITQIQDYLRALQERITAALQEYEGQSFGPRIWQSSLGHGRGYTVDGGAVLERAGINYSRVAGASLPQAASASRPELGQGPYRALGLSLVIHPRNPHAPTVHFNARYFETDAVANSTPQWWFGGGMDLSPYYGYEEDCRHFHTTCQAALEPFGAELYPAFKKNCDDYFCNRHRNEQRGIGGILFDDYHSSDFGSAFALTQAIGNAFLPAYEPILQRRYKLSYGDQERQHQLLRRGRYVEFNLIHDRGTLFGLQSGGQAEAILMSLPPQAAWRTGYSPPPGSAEAELTIKFLQPRDWL